MAYSELIERDSALFDISIAGQRFHIYHIVYAGLEIHLVS